MAHGVGTTRGKRSKGRTAAAVGLAWLTACLAACGKEDAARPKLADALDEGETPEKAFVASLAGAWKRACGESTRLSTSETITFESSDYKRQVRFFLDQQCGRGAFVLDSEGSLSFAGKVGTGPGGSTPVDLRVQVMTITLLADEVVASFNTNSQCGRKDWKKDQPFLLSDSCEYVDGEEDVDINGLIEHDIAKSRDGKLWLGEKDRGERMLLSKPVLRPKALSGTAFIR